MAEFESKVFPYVCLRLISILTIMGLSLTIAIISKWRVLKVLAKEGNPG